MDLADRIIGLCFNEYNGILSDNLLAIGNMINVGRDRTAINYSKIAQYSAILDEVVCPLCEYLDGMYFEVGSKEYYKYMPRVHNHCRCIYVYIAKDEVKQPKSNFKEPPKKLRELGHLITGTQSVAGAIANTATVSSLIQAPTDLPSKYSSISYETGNQKVDNAIIDVVNNYDYPVEVVQSFVDKVHEALLFKGEVAAISEALNINDIYIKYIKQVASDNGINIIGKLTPLKLQLVYDKISKLSQALQDVGLSIDTIKISKSASYKDGVISTDGTIPLYDIVDAVDSTLGINTKWSIENNEPNFTEALIDMMAGEVNDNVRTIAAMLNINPKDWDLKQEVV